MSNLIGTELWVSKSQSGRGLTLRITERRILPVLEQLRDKDAVFLHLPVSQIEKLILGDVKGVQFAMADSEKNNGSE